MYVTFRVGALPLAVPAAAVAEIVPATGVRRLPGMAPGVAGVLIGAGGVVGIVDPGRLMEAAAEGARAVVVLAGEPRLGMLVESPDAVPHGRGEPGPAVVDASVPLQGVLRSAGRMFHRVDLDRLRERLRALPAGRRQRGGEDGDPDPGGG